MGELVLGEGRGFGRDGGDDERAAVGHHAREQRDHGRELVARDLAVDDHARATTLAGSTQQDDGLMLEWLRGSHEHEVERGLRTVEASHCTAPEMGDIAGEVRGPERTNGV